ncbi:FAD-binding oxidoreductase [Archangium violaceum]|uniref:FAD-binding oxidoreductase n=1 Tax=Archangium violaceum TaxID=83451 RepID=UPI002B2ACD10|nr:FAD-binding oxidoreductase [Archangium gephyra]
MSEYTSQQPVTDWGRMQSAPVRAVVHPADEEQLRRYVVGAVASGAKVSIRGIGHSAGGQSFCRDAVMIDMRNLKRVLEFDAGSRTIRVQAGASWADLTPLLEVHGLSVTTKQEFDSFTLGGSIAANVHGKTIEFGPLIESIQSLRLLRADGRIINVSREENADLFPAVVGGYGLAGVVVDVTLALALDRVVEKSEVILMRSEPLCASYIQRLKSPGERPALCYGFLDATCSQGFYVTYTHAHENGDGDLRRLKRNEPPPLLFNAFVWLQQRSKFARDRAFQVMVHTASHSERTLRSRRLLLWDDIPGAFDSMLLQKYVVPVERFHEFTRAAGQIFARHPELPLLTNHFRFVPGNSEALLALAPRDSICMIPCYLARKDDARWVEKLALATHELLDAALALGGSYYLAFDTLATPEQFQRAYPKAKAFFALKRAHDPDETFSSFFYEKYGALSPLTKTGDVSSGGSVWASPSRTRAASRPHPHAGPDWPTSPARR